MTATVTDDVLRELVTLANIADAGNAKRNEFGRIHQLKYDHGIAMARELLALRKRVAEQQWRPISEAPKDGTEVLLFSKYDGVGCGRWYERTKVWRGTFCGSDAVDYMSDFGTYYKEHSIPTHWLPLPSPPQR